MPNTARGVMKIPTATFGSETPIGAVPNGTAGVKYETITSMTGTEQSTCRGDPDDRDRWALTASESADRDPAVGIDVDVFSDSRPSSRRARRRSPRVCPALLWSIVPN